MRVTGLAYGRHCSLHRDTHAHTYRERERDKTIKPSSIYTTPCKAKGHFQAGRKHDPYVIDVS